MPDTRSEQSGEPTAESAAGEPLSPARGRGSAGVHYEADADQIVKVVHQVKPDHLPVQGPTDFDTRGPTETAAHADVRVTPAAPSVQEAGPDRD